MLALYMGEPRTEQSCVVEQTAQTAMYSRNARLGHRSWGRNTLPAPLFPAGDMHLALVQKRAIAHLLAPISYELFQGAPNFLHITFIDSMV